jgi:hypothetical protein
VNERRPPPSGLRVAAPPGFAPAPPRLRIVSEVSSWLERCLLWVRWISCLPSPGRVPGVRISGLLLGAFRPCSGVLVPVSMRLRARNRCPGSSFAAAVDVGLGCMSAPAASGISCGYGSPVIRSRAAFFLGSKLFPDSCAWRNGVTMYSAELLSFS